MTNATGLAAGGTARVAQAKEPGAKMDMMGRLVAVVGGAMVWARRRDTPDTQATGLPPGSPSHGNRV